ncbi:glycolate oxidase subunit GlcE [Gellertiella hungarica]|uniref:Glycolate oxidase FAD binding subunit n=1 Tax=Gellertiella hungarica TaxID=1572859 RepID=A0A7W6J3T6_9HYPH|nr:glycolate oxidase subunit GlcE [Gellertiella hungarica]MBB4064279.1 glycolate oxidase FAD binding subunit [Gellertiella hungarica]
MRQFYYPRTEAEAADIVRSHIASKMPLRIAGGNTRALIGHPVAAEYGLRSTSLSGILAYNPAEMVMTARAGTPVREIEAALAERNQMLAFEPMDHRGVLGTSGEPTIGGLFAVNSSGPRRLTAGAARDHLLGIRFVNGRGEAIKAGGRVMKNVTGLDLVKLLAGSHGTLGFLTEVTFKVLPAQAETETVLVSGLGEAEAAIAMATAMALPVEVSAAAHLPFTVRHRFLGNRLPDGAATIFRLEGLKASVKARLQTLVSALAGFGPVSRIAAPESRMLWQEVRDCRAYADGTSRALWRISVAPSAGHRIVAALRLEAGVDACYDWQGGLVWMRMEADPEADMLRRLIKAAGGGHATLIRASEAVRASVPVFEPQAPAVAALSARVKAALDPDGIFNPGLMYQEKGER